MDLKQSTQNPTLSPPSVEFESNSDNISWIHAWCFAFLTFNSITAIGRSKNDPWNKAFIAASYTDIVLLFWCLRMFERTPEASSRRSRFKLAIWSLSTLLTLMFSYKVAKIMPLAMEVVVWLMAGSSIAWAFYAFFLNKVNEYGVLEADETKKRNEMMV